MKPIDLDRLIGNQDLLNEKLKSYKKDKTIRCEEKNEPEIKGHVEKAQHNLDFIKDNLKLGYYDWCITGCYYAAYHAALALILAKGYHSKNHDATLCLLIKQYYKRGIAEEDIILINKFFLDYHDLLFYIQSKNKREEATYSTNYKFDKPLVEELRVKAILFINKAREILGQQHA